MVVLLALVALAGVLRLVGLGDPGTRYFDETYYAADACLYVHSARACGYEPGAVPSAPEHPPLGVWMTAAGIEALGNRPVGWRAPAALVGTATVALAYAVARLLLRTRTAAAVAAGLLAIDPLHLVQSRIAMLDVFVVGFAMTALLLAVLDLRASRPNWRYRLGAGAAAGAAIATKWSGVLALVAVILVVLVGDRRRRSAPRWGALAVALLAVPALVYVGAYAGRLHGDLFAAPWSAHSWVRAFLGRQRAMADFQLGLDGRSPYASPAWSWPLLKRPTPYWFAIDGRGRFREILATGNPLAWWVGVLAVVAAAVHWVRSARRRVAADAAAVVATIAALTAWVPWLVVARGRSFTFLYYFVTVVPALYLAVAWLGERAVRGVPAKAAAAVFVAATIAVGAFLHPVLTGRALSPGEWRSRQLFTSCGEGADTRAARVVGPYRRTLARARGADIPVPGVGDAPSGWCWI